MTEVLSLTTSGFIGLDLAVRLDAVILAVALLSGLSPSLAERAVGVGRLEIMFCCIEGLLPCRLVLL